MNQYTQKEWNEDFLAELEQKAPTLTWDDFLDHFEWEQSQHVGIIGPTGSGKTNMAIYLLSLRKYVIALATKPKDETIDALVSQDGFKKFKKWLDRPAFFFPKRVIWPDARELYALGKQRREFQRALEHIYVEGGWSVYVDETWFLIHQLKLEQEFKLYLLQARSNNISLIATSQRPAWIPVEMFDQSDHLFFYRDNDERNLKTISGISWLSAKMVQSIVARLERFQFLYVNTRTGEMYKSTAPPPPENPKSQKAKEGG